jgi:excisionase family DNA binding protein
MCDQLLLRVEQAAKRLNIGRSLAYRLIQSGRLPSVRVSGARRVLVSDLEQFAASLKEREDDGE